MQCRKMIGVLASGMLAVVVGISGRSPAIAQDAETNPATDKPAVDKPAADKPEAEKPGCPADRVALVDLTKILKVHRKFILSMNAMKTSVDEAEQKLKTKRDDIAEREKDLAKLKPGSDEYRKLSEKIFDDKNAFNGEAAKDKARLLEEETVIYAVTYKDIAKCIGQYADRHGIRLVLRTNLDEAPAVTREEVAKEMSKPVVYQKGADITDEIIKLVNGSAASEKHEKGK